MTGAPFPGDLNRLSEANRITCPRYTSPTCGVPRARGLGLGFPLSGGYTFCMKHPEKRKRTTHSGPPSQITTPVSFRISNKLLKDLSRLAVVRHIAGRRVFMPAGPTPA